MVVIKRYVLCEYENKEREAIGSFHPEIKFDKKYCLPSCLTIHSKCLDGFLETNVYPYMLFINDYVFIS